MTDRIILVLRGGTKLRMSGERNLVAPYDKLLDAMKKVEVWSEDEQKWRKNGWMIQAMVEEAK